MKNIKALTVGSLLVALVLSLTLGVQGSSAPAEPVASTSVINVLEAHPFRLDAAAVHEYRAERPAYDRGWLLVLETDPVLLTPRQTFEPVLYVGDETAQRVNVGDVTGRLVVIVPELDGSIDPAAAPVYFGEPDLPERVTRAAARAELQAARDRGVTGHGPLGDRVREPVQVRDAWELTHFAAGLVEKHSPVETDLISGLRAPLLVR